MMDKMRSLIGPNFEHSPIGVVAMELLELLLVFELDYLPDS
jgi:hypothetical protein